MAIPSRNAVFRAMFLMVASAYVAIAQPQRAIRLRTEYLDGPVYGLDVAKPRFSWAAAHSTRAASQTAYQILVSSSPSVQRGDVWDSGRVSSNRTTQIVYGGPALVSDTSYYWTVTWWDNWGQQAPTSLVELFHTGLFETNAWTGSWIGGFNQLRKEFTINTAVTQATLFICGLGYHEVYLNGQKVGLNKLDPGWTQYAKRSYYVAHDVTSMLKQGGNAVGVMLGGGWYTQGDGQPSRLLFQLNMKSGSSNSSLTSDATWKGAQGPITMDSIYNGETYDARLEQPGWTSAGFNDASWTNAKSIAAPGGVISAQMIPPIQELGTVAPINMTSPSAGVFVIDFGQNLAGWVRWSVKGAAGTTVTLRHAEILQHDGSGNIYTDNLRTAKATDTYTLRGDPNGETYEPRFTYHGFRFVEVTGYPGTPVLSNFVAVHVGSSMTQTGSLLFDNPVLNQVQSNILWGQRDNLMSVPTDCCQRDERLGWMADGHLSSEEAIHNFFMPAFYSAWVRLMTDDEQTGEIPDTVPHMRYGSEPGDPSWSAAFPLLTDYIWQYYDDLTVLAQNYAGLKSYFEFMYGKVQQSGIGKFFEYYGDWVPPPPQQKCSGSFTSAWFYLLNMQQFIDMANALNQTSDAALWTQRLQQLIPQFNAAFYHTSTHTYDIGVQTTQSLALRFPALIPNNEAANISFVLLNDIWNQGTHLTTGIIGTKYLMETLSLLGRDDVGLDLALQTTYPSWGYMHFQPVETPATTLWELWDSPAEGPGMNSRNHIMFGSVAAFFYNTLAGIRQQPGTRGYQHFVIQPPSANVLAVSPISIVSGALEFLSGPVATAWTRSGGRKCAVAPENSEVTISCGSGTIQTIQFASFGLPSGSCGAYSINSKCHAANSMSIVQQQCVGRSSCTISVNDVTFGDPCYGTYKTFAAQAVCSAGPTYSVEASIPANTDAEVHVSKIALSNIVIEESGKPVWQNGAFQQGVAGIKSAYDNGGEVVFQIGSGDYTFYVTGSAGTPVCGNAKEHGAITLSCPASQKISLIEFASFGTPTYNSNNACGNGMFSYGSCHAGSSKQVIESLCLYKNSCTITAEDWYFGDPCYDTLKSLAVSAVCSA